MNIFLDTTLLFQDPFLKNNSNKLLLRLVERSNGKIYVSSVVLDEAKEHLRKNVEKAHKDIEKALNEIGKICKTKIELTQGVDINKISKEFDEFFISLQEKNLVNLVVPDNEFLPDLINRAIKRRKPFSETKSEFRDAVIWLSYANKINVNRLSQNYFITNNISDFYDTDKICIHPELGKDCNFPVKMAKQANEVLNDFGGMIIEAVENEQLRLNLLNSDELITEVHSEYSYIVEGFFENFVYAKYYSLYTRHDYFDNVELIGFEVKSIDRIELSKSENDIYAYGEMTIKVDIGLLKFNEETDSMDRFILADSIYSMVSVRFSLLLDNEEKNENFEIIEVIKTTEYI